MTDYDVTSLTERLEQAQLGAVIEERGIVTAIADGLASLSGLRGAGLNEVLEFDGGVRGFVMTIEEAEIKAAFLDRSDAIAAGCTVRRLGHLLSVPVGPEMLGRVIDPLGRALDGLPDPVTSLTLPAERPAPTIIERDFVSKPLETGILVIDALFAIGRGQRELIIGERQTGKTSLAVDAMLAQRGGPVITIYVAIGQRSAAVTRVIETLRSQNAMDRTIVMVADPAGEPGLRWLAPFAATSLAEWFRDQGEDVLIVYDDLTKHAAVHRELALLAQQPPGREAYPGDIFYLHARLLERSGKVRNGGSITALPIAEIEAGNLSAYIPTNLISISDGQIVTSASLFAANQRPAVDVGLSVSRVGGKAQSKALKSVAGRLRLDYAQYLEMKMFARFGGFGDAAQADRMIRGERIAALFIQDRLLHLSTWTQIALLAGLEAGVLDRITPRQINALKTLVATRVDNDPYLADLDAPLTDEIRNLCAQLVAQAAETL